MSIRLNKKGVISYIGDHELLDNRNKENQHNIESITGLKSLLESKYTIPTGGIPPQVLDRVYVEFSEYLKFVNSNNLTLVEMANDILELTRLTALLQDSSLEVEREINTIKGEIEVIKNKLSNGIAGDCSNTSTYVEQIKFTSNEIENVLEIEIADNDLKLIEPTVMEILNSECVLTKDYKVTYPSRKIMRIEFLRVGEFLINYLAGEITETEFNVLIEYIKKLENKIENISPANGGTYINPKSEISIIHDEFGRVVSETYVGDISKIISYEYDSNDNITKKTVSLDGTIKTAIYQYDEFQNLIFISDNGTEIPIDGTKARSFDCAYTYDSSGKVISEIFTGEINKRVDFIHNGYGDVILKTVTEGDSISTAKYIYDANRSLIKIEDTGTEKIAIVFHGENCSGNSGGQPTPGVVDSITKPEIDLIFETIFK